MSALLSPLDRVVKGLGILKAHDDTRGDVSCGDDRMVYAGPQEVTLPAYDAQRLTMLGWEFDEEIGRWGISL